MKKFIVETYYTCTFKTVHTLNELNDQELAKIDERKRKGVKEPSAKVIKRPKKKIIYDDFGEPLREVWVDD